MSEHGINFKDTKLVEHQFNLYKIIMDSIVPPSDEQKIFGNITENNKLGLLIIEPREHEWFKPVLYNMAHVYGGKNVPLYIVHGNKNEQYIKNELNDWTNVNYLKLDIDNLTIKQYNNLLTNPSFWNLFNTEFILLFQTDTFIRRTIPEIFFMYHYIGAPWKWFPSGSKRCVGNGGFSLRKTSVMKNICEKYVYNEENDENEDVFFAKNIDMDFCPPPALASCFSVEHIYNDDPIGLHQIWRFQNFEDIFKLVNQTAGVPFLQYGK